MKINHASVRFDARSENESFARMVVMGFMMEMNPTMDELQDVKTAVSEAVTNAIIHGYGEGDTDGQISEGQVEMTCAREGQKLIVTIEDHGIGIMDVEKARQPFFTTKPEQERSGMGFAFMETFMDEFQVNSRVGAGTCITMSKYIKNEDTSAEEQSGQ